MLTRFNAIEAQLIEFNRWLYAESVGLDVPETGYAGPAQHLLQLWADLLEEDPLDPAVRYWAVEAASEARLAGLDQALAAEQDRLLTIPGLRCSEGPLTWRNWKCFEREASAAQRQEAFEQFVERSAGLVPHLEERWAVQRANFAAAGLTPVDTFCWRETLNPGALRELLQSAGRAGAATFQALAGELSQAVFGIPAGPAELRALYLNRMYEPTTLLFADRPDWVPHTLAVFNRLGFDLSRIPVDLEPRPRKYPGAFCFPIAIPGDVRVSVRMASAHHLVDMLYHELGHAVHFSSIDADLPVVDRYWIHSGQHETFSTLFEYLLAEPEFLQEQLGLADGAVERLLRFQQFKERLTEAWLGACALTVLEGWLEVLTWTEVEQRLALHMREFTGVTVPPGFARLEAFTSALSIYPAGYVLAHGRVRRWQTAWTNRGITAWWRSAEAWREVRSQLRAGGRAHFAGFEPESTRG